MINVFEGSKWRSKRITNLKGSMVINSKNEVGVRIRVTTPKRGGLSHRCRTGVRGKYCKVMTFTEFPKSLHYESSSDLIYFGDTICAEVRDRRIFFGRKVKFTKNCDLKVNKSNRVYQVNLIDKST